MESCFFCEKRPAEDRSVLNVDLRKQVGPATRRGGRLVTKWATKTVMVPRCPSCAKYHRSFSQGGGFLGGLGCLAPIAGSVLIIEATRLGTLLNILVVSAGVLVGLGLSILIIKLLARSAFGEAGEHTDNEDKKSEFPAVKRLLDDGWEFPTTLPG